MFQRKDNEQGRLNTDFYEKENVCTGLMSHNPAAGRVNIKLKIITLRPPLKDDEWTNTVEFDATRSAEKVLEEDLKIS